MPQNIGGAILGIVLSVALAIIAVLVGGLFYSVTGDVFKKVGINSSTLPAWYNLYTAAGDYATTAISIAIVSIVFVGIGVLLWVVMGFFGGKKGV